RGARGCGVSSGLPLGGFAPVAPVGASTVRLPSDPSHEFGPFAELDAPEPVMLVIGIRWETDGTGAYRVYSRQPADRKSRFTLNASASATVTYQTNGINPAPAVTADLQFLYEGTEPANGWPSPLWLNPIYQRGVQRFASRSAAFAAS